MIALPPCPEEVQMLVLGLPDGVLTPEEEERAIEHVAHCDSCRYMLEFYGECTDDSGEEPAEEDSKKKPWLEIPIAVASGGLRALEGAHLREGERPRLLSGGKGGAGMLEFSVPLEEGRSALIRIVRTGERMTLEIDAGRPGARYYLISGDEFRVTRPEGSVASFEGLRPRDMLVSEEMKRFVKISVREDGAP